MIGSAMWYGTWRSVWLLAAAPLVLVGCRWNFHDMPDGQVEADAEPPCEPAVAVKAIAAGHAFACAQLADDSLRCWGANEIGQLGDGTRTTAVGAGVTPVGLPSVSAFALGHEHACAIRDGDVYCWGRNDIGQLGVGNYTSRTVPTRVNLPEPMVGIVTGGLTSCAWNAAGSLYCWGQTTGIEALPSNVPREVPGIPPVRGGVIATSRFRFSADHVCVLGVDDSMWCWGDNGDYQLGTGDTTDQVTPIESVTALRFASLASGDAHLCGRTAEGDVYCWGRNLDGQCGVAGTDPVMGPTRVNISDVVELVARYETTCARTSSGEVYCWGDNDSQQLGRDGADAFAPERIAMPPAQALARATDATCALGTDGVVRCWGSEYAGVISGVASRSASTTNIPGIAQLDAHGMTTCVRTTDGEVYCWGAGSLGQLGDGQVSPASSTPQRVPLPRAATHLAVGSHHACARLDDATMACWGDNEDGTIGDLDAPFRAPTVIAGIPAVIDVAAGGLQSCAVTAGAPWCWGHNSEGALGYYSGSGSRLPQASTFPTMVMLEAGGLHTCGLTAAQQLVCAGRNNENQIGNDGSDDVYTPYTLPLAQVSSVAGGELFTCAASEATSEVWCWGHYTSGQLGLGTDVQAKVPTLLPAMPATRQLAAGRGHACALDTANMVRCWGSNANGQLATGSLTSAASPLVASELTGATQIAAGYRHTCGLLLDGSVRCVGSNDRGQLGGDAPIPTAAPRQAVLTCPTR